VGSSLTTEACSPSVEARDGQRPERRRSNLNDARSNPQGPLWLRAVERLERAIGEPVEAWVHSDIYFDLVAGAMRARARVARLSEAISSRSFHLFNLPAGSDIRDVREQLSRIERRLAQLAKELDELESRRDESHGPRLR
jgi:hypothetical protein